MYMYIVDYGQKDSGIITQYVPPHSDNAAILMKEVCGKTKGIQGSRNSCYLDATLYSMFAHCTVFDRSVLARMMRFATIAWHAYLLSL